MATMSIPAQMNAIGVVKCLAKVRETGELSKKAARCRSGIWRYCFRRLFFGIIKTKKGGKRYADDLQISGNQDFD
ncbi:MAG: hypothetical protein ACLVB5_07395 [Christensenellales bacterium]